MGRIYAGILGPLAVAVVALRGVFHGGALEPSLMTVWLSLVVFSAVGYAVGRLADWIVAESVRASLAGHVRASERNLSAGEQVAT